MHRFMNISCIFTGSGQAWGAPYPPSNYSMTLPPMPTGGYNPHNPYMSYPNPMSQGYPNPQQQYPGKWCHKNEALPGVLGNLFQGNKRHILRGTGKQRQYWGTENIRKQFFDLWGIGEQANLFQGNKGLKIR